MILIPTPMNNVALNMACVSKWTKQNVTMFNLREVIIRPSCLKVDKATVFFMSGCPNPHHAPPNEVMSPDVKRMLLMLCGT